MKIAALYGAGNVGKTTTLKKLLAKILRSVPSFDDVADTSLSGNTVDELIANLFANDTDNCKTDCYAVVKINGRFIGVTTYGDNDSTLKDHFKHFANCDLCFCAARTHGSSCNCVYDQANDDVVVWYRQTKVSASNSVDVDSRRDAANDSMADLLYAELDLL